MATPQRALPELLQDIVGNFQEIIRSEFVLAKTEIGEKAQLASGPLAGLLTGIMLGLFGTAFLLWAAVFALSTVMSIWAASLLVGGALLLISLPVIASSKKKLKQINPAPSKTIRSLEGMTHGRNV